jgi:nucleoside-diphosphate-sugar epimerase
MILITGTSGFIGKHLLTALIDNFGQENVLALTSVPTDQCPFILHEDYTFSNSVFESEGYSDKIETIILAGAFTPKSSRYANDWYLCNRNILSLDKVLQVPLPNLKKIIYLSTLDVYGGSELITEQSIVMPATLYGDSKYYGEKFISAFCEARSLICHVLRVGHVYGPGEEAYEKLIPATMKSLLKDEPVQLWGDGKNTRAFIYIDDVVTAILNSLSVVDSISPVNLVSAQSITIRELLEKIISISKKDCEIKYIPHKQDNRNLTFDSGKMMKYLLKAETPLDLGLESEWQYMLNKSR